MAFVYACAFMGQSIPTTALIQQFDTLPTQYRHIEHMHEGVWFKKNDSYENLGNFLIQSLIYRRFGCEYFCILILTKVPDGKFKI